ncbi:hypothetical protein KSS87_019647 [Heliosperma pusillum]|nr:hypothetical protein KSS87_019647 [Heliosperma pusillum]
MPNPTSVKSEAQHTSLFLVTLLFTSTLFNSQLIKTQKRCKLYESHYKK